MAIDNQCYLEIFNLLSKKKKSYLKLKQFVKTWYGNVHFVRLILIDSSLEVIRNRDIEDNFVYPTPDEPSWNNDEIWAKTNSNKFYTYLIGLASTSYYRIVYDKGYENILAILVFYNGKNEPLKDKHEIDSFFKKMVTVVKKSLR